MSMLDLRLAQARILTLVWEKTAARVGRAAATAILTEALEGLAVQSRLRL